MTELQALAISSRLASSGYWFSKKKLKEGRRIKTQGADINPSCSQPPCRSEEEEKNSSTGLKGKQIDHLSAPLALRLNLDWIFLSFFLNSCYLIFMSFFSEEKKVQSLSHVTKHSRDHLPSLRLKTCDPLLATLHPCLYRPWV